MTEFHLLPDEPRKYEPHHPPKLLGQKPPLKPKEVWAIRIRLQIKCKHRDLALFNLAIDSKLRSCDLVALRISDVVSGGSARERTTIVQQKAGRPVQFEMTEQTREAVQAWIRLRGLDLDGFLFPSRVHTCPHISTRQYARIVKQWIASIGLDPCKYGTHSLRRTKATQIYRKTGNLRAAQLLLGHTKLESTVRYLGIEVDDALQISEQVEL
jgi:integrase